MQVPHLLALSRGLFGEEKFFRGRKFCYVAGGCEQIKCFWEEYFVMPSEGVDNKNILRCSWGEIVHGDDQGKKMSRWTHFYLSLFK